MFSDIKYYLKISFPSLTIFFLIFFNLFFANNFFDFGQLFILHAIFFWLLNFPKLIPFYIILIASLVQDIIYLSPLGSTALVFFLPNRRWIRGTAAGKLSCQARRFFKLLCGLFGYLFYLSC